MELLSKKKYFGNYGRKTRVFLDTQRLSPINIKLFLDFKQNVISFYRFLILSFENGSLFCCSSASFKHFLHVWGEIPWEKYFLKGFEKIETELLKRKILVSKYMCLIKERDWKAVICKFSMSKEIEDLVIKSLLFSYNRKVLYICSKSVNNRHFRRGEFVRNSQIDMYKYMDVCCRKMCPLFGNVSYGDFAIYMYISYSKNFNYIFMIINFT